jgi:hypothetical protein
MSITPHLTPIQLYRALRAIDREFTEHPLTVAERRAAEELTMSDETEVQAVQQREDPDDDPSAELREALAKEQAVTAWISIDVEKLRPMSRGNQANAVLDAAALIRDSLVRELARHEIAIDPRRLRRGWARIAPRTP